MNHTCSGKALQETQAFSSTCAWNLNKAGITNTGCSPAGLFVTLGSHVGSSADMISHESE